MSVVLIPTAPRINLVDDAGKITRPWQSYFDDVFSRIGGNVAPSIDELQAAIEAIEDLTTRIEGLSAMVGELRGQIQTLQAGEMISQPGQGQETLPDVTQMQPWIDPYAAEMKWQT